MNAFFANMRIHVLRRVFFTMNSYKNNGRCFRHFSSNTNVGLSTSPNADNSLSSPGTNSENEAAQFRYLLRNSNFINMGDPAGKIVCGKIFRTINDDLYIDFGWKFHCVCQKPTKDAELYVRGAEVLLRIKDLELSSHFLGSEKALTLLEADAIIIRLISSPRKKKNQ